MNTKTTFNLGHFFSGNTPALIEKIGNIALILATLSAIIMGIPATFAASGLTLELPAIVLTIAKVMMALSIIIKAITKCFGVIDTATGDKVSTTTLAAPDAAPTK